VRFIKQIFAMEEQCVFWEAETELDAVYASKH